MKLRYFPELRPNAGASGLPHGDAYYQVKCEDFLKSLLLKNLIETLLNLIEASATSAVIVFHFLELSANILA